MMAKELSSWEISLAHGETGREGASALSIEFGSRTTSLALCESDFVALVAEASEVFEV